RSPRPAGGGAAVPVTGVRRGRVITASPGGVGSRGVPPGGRRERGPTSSRGLARGSARALRGDVHVTGPPDVTALKRGRQGSRRDGRTAAPRGCGVAQRRWVRMR